MTTPGSRPSAPGTERADVAARRAFRAWVREHHPDAGGDAGAFAAGLAAWRERLAAGHGPADRVPVTVFRARGGLWPVERWWRRRRQPARRVI